MVRELLDRFNPKPEIMTTDRLSVAQLDSAAKFKVKETVELQHPPDIPPLPTMPYPPLSWLPKMLLPCSAPTTLSGSPVSKDIYTDQVQAGRGHSHVVDGGGWPGEFCGHDTTKGRPVNLRKPNMKYSADKYNLSSIRTKGRRSARRAM